MKPIRKNIIAAFIGSCFFVCACENKMETIRDLGKKKIGVEEAVQIESYLSQNGKVKAQLTAPLMLRYQYDTPKTEFPKTLHVNFFDDSLKVESQLKAKYGRYFENQNQVFLRDSVVVFNISGDTMYTNELYWDQQQQIFYTEKNVIIKKPDQKIYGTGLRANQSLKDVTIKNPRGYIMIADSSFLGN